MRENLGRIIRLIFLPLAILGLCVIPLHGQSDSEKLYKAKCLPCHAADGSGNTPAGKKLGARDLRSKEVQGETDEQLLEIVKKGKNKMPAYSKTLKDDEVKELVTYIRELAKKK